MTGRGLAKRFLAIICLGAALSAPAAAQVPGLTTEAPAPAAPPAAPTDPLGRDTPNGFIGGLMKALAEQDYGRAAQYIDQRHLPRGKRGPAAEAIARDLQQVLDEGGWLARNWQLNTQPAGQIDDGLAPELERFASVRTAEGTVPLLAERVKTAEGTQVWVVSSATAERLPALLAQVKLGLLQRAVPDDVPLGPRLFGVPLVHWGALVLFAGLSYGVAWFLTALIGLRLPWRRRPETLRRRITDAAIPPLRLGLAVWLFVDGGAYLGVSVIAREAFGLVSQVVGWGAVAWFLWRMIDTVAATGIERMARRSRTGAVSGLRLAQRAAKVLVAAALVMGLLNFFGVDVTAGLAALGIGGLAIALGAQKTFENLIGSLMLVADQPIREGDFCRFGDTTGTVEDIGMRSTRIRTLNRTVVTIPNGEFASMQIENYARRDMFWFHPLLALRYETTPDQIRYLLVEIRALLYSHPRVDPDPARVRFLGLGADSLTIEVFAYVHAIDYSEFLEVQEDLTLRIMDIVADSGAAFAFPSQTLYMAQDSLPDADKRVAAEQRVAQWKQAGELQLPTFAAERIEALRATLPYPPDGSASRRSGPGTAATAADGTPSATNAETTRPPWLPSSVRSVLDRLAQSRRTP
jgi:MscS family membrane protein